MSNISITDNQLNEMLEKLSLEKIEDLFKIIPDSFKYDIDSLSIKEVSSFSLSDILFIMALTNTLSGKRSSRPSSMAFNCCMLIFKSVANSLTD